MQTAKNTRVGNEQQFGQAGKCGCLAEEFCPFYVEKNMTCKLATSRGVVCEKRQQRCCSDDYDDCSTYLAFLLRRSRPLRRDSDWLDAV